MTMNRDELLARMAEHLFRKFEVRHATVAWNDAPQKWRDEWLEEAREIFAMVLPQRPEGAAVAKPDHWKLREWASMFSDHGFVDAADDLIGAADFIEGIGYCEDCGGSGWHTEYGNDGVPCGDSPCDTCNPNGDAEREAVACGNVMVGSGTDVYDPLCELPKRHSGDCKSSAATDQHKLGSPPASAVAEPVASGEMSSALYQAYAYILARGGLPMKDHGCAKCVGDDNVVRWPGADQNFICAYHRAEAYMVNAPIPAQAATDELAELRLDRDAFQKYLEEIRAIFGWQSEPREGLARKVLDRIRLLSQAATVSDVLHAQGVFKGAHGLEGLANATDFWEKQPYGTRLYYGDGIADYLHIDVLRAAIRALASSPAAPAPVESDETSIEYMRRHSSGGI